jgi:Bifunctional DNA primase/polymerase, N-terminal
VVPIPPKAKAPRLAGCDRRIYKLDDLPDAFAPDGNIGVILGARSRAVVDVDLDCSEALTLADIYLPATDAVFGWASKPRSHWLYLAVDARYESFSNPSSGEFLLELRAEGENGGAHQTVVPPSVHPSGEPIRWASEVIAPLLIEAKQLRHRLAYWRSAVSSPAMFRRLWRRKLLGPCRCRCGELITISVALALAGSMSRHRTCPEKSFAHTGY